MPFHLLLHKAYLLFPLLAAMLYAGGALSLKAASGLGADRNRTTVVCNICAALAFLFFYDWHSFPALPHPLWPVLLLALLFVLGQICTIEALSSGDVSSVTPVFSVKVVCVSFYAAFVIGTRLSPLTWVAAVLSVLGIACLQVNHKPETSGRQLLAILFAFLASACFGGFDAMTQYWSPIIGFGRLVPPGLMLAALASLAILPLMPGARGTSWRGIPRGALRYLAIGVGLFTLQSLVLIRAIGAYGDAAGANVVYSTRGLWGIFLVWLVGSWFGNIELDACPQKVIYARIIGALLVSTATLLVFL